METFKWITLIDSFKSDITQGLVFKGWNIYHDQKNTFIRCWLQQYGINDFFFFFFVFLGISSRNFWSLTVPDDSETWRWVSWTHVLSLSVTRQLPSISSMSRWESDLRTEFCFRSRHEPDHDSWFWSNIFQIIAQIDWSNWTLECY